MPFKHSLMSVFVFASLLSPGFALYAAPQGRSAARRHVPAHGMHITASAVSLTVDNVAKSSKFLVTHFGFREKMAAPGFSSLTHPDAAINVIFLQRGITVLPKGFRDQHAAGVIVAFVVTDLNAEEARLRREGVAITMPLREEPWGERLFQVTDPNGVIFELVQWVTPKTR